MEVNDNAIVSQGKNLGTKLNLPSESRAYTDLGRISRRHIWTLNNFKEHCQLKGYIQSSSFGNDNVQWNLKLSTSSDRHTSHSKWVTLHVAPTNNETDISAKCKVAILNSRNEEVHTASEIYKFQKNYDDWGLMFCFIELKYLLDHSNKFLPQDNLIILLEISLIPNGTNYFERATSGCGSSLVQDFESLLENHELSDVTLSVAGREFQAHKLILSARSPVFRAMFNSQMEESISNVVNIIDLDEDVVKEMLRFIYTGHVSFTGEILNGLLSAAEKYNLTELKFLCERELYGKLSVGNAAEMLTVADLHNALQLKAHVIDFIKAHSSEIKWHGLIPNHHLMKAIFPE